MQTTYYRLDEYPGAIGNLKGFYSDLLSAIQEAESEGPTMSVHQEPTKYPYYQITEFSSDHPAPCMEAWENGQIVANHYLTPIPDAVRIM